MLYFQLGLELKLSMWDLLIWNVQILAKANLFSIYFAMFIAYYYGVKIISINNEEIRLITKKVGSTNSNWY